MDGNQSGLTSTVTSLQSSDASSSSPGSSRVVSSPAILTAVEQASGTSTVDISISAIFAQDESSSQFVTAKTESSSTPSEQSSILVKSSISTTFGVRPTVNYPPALPLSSNSVSATRRSSFSTNSTTLPSPPYNPDTHILGPKGESCASLGILEKLLTTYTHINDNETHRGANGRIENDEYMICECTYDPSAEDAEEDDACGDNHTCINRSLNIECTEDCPVDSFCRNKRFQKKHYAPIEVFQTEKKGFGLRAIGFIPKGSFVIEYCGEIISQATFQKRTLEYSVAGAKHFYFMSIKSNEYIDASKKGNISRFMNHSCNPNCRLEKWVVGPYVRMGMFTLADIDVNTELTFDYKFETYGTKAQPCYCGEPNCKGTIGGLKHGAGDVAVTSIESPEIGKIDEDLDEDEESEHEPKGLISLQQIQTLVKKLYLASKNQVQIMTLLLKLEHTDIKILRHFIAFHGVKILRTFLRDFIASETFVLCNLICRILKLLPFTNSNAVKPLEPFLNQLETMRNSETAQSATELLERWADLPFVYKIPKKSSRWMDAEAEKDEKDRTANINDSSRISSWMDSSSALPTPATEQPESRYRIVRPAEQLTAAITASTKPSPNPTLPFNHSQSSSSMRHDFSLKRKENFNYDRREGMGCASSSSNHKDSPESRRSARDDTPQSTHSNVVHFVKPKWLPNWTSAQSDSGELYYYNTVTMETQWEEPIDPSSKMTLSASNVVPYTNSSSTITSSPQNNANTDVSVVTTMSVIDIEAIISQAVNAVDPGAPSKSQSLETHAAKKKHHNKSKDDRPSKKHRSAADGKLASASSSASKDHKRKRTIPDDPVSADAMARGWSGSDLKKLKVEISGIVIKQMSKVKSKIKEQKFKDLAKALTGTLIEKELKRPRATTVFEGLSEKSVDSAKAYLKNYLRRKGFIDAKSSSSSVKAAQDESQGGESEVATPMDDDVDAEEVGDGDEEDLSQYPPDVEDDLDYEEQDDDFNDAAASVNVDEDVQLSSDQDTTMGASVAL